MSWLDARAPLRWRHGLVFLLVSVSIYVADQVSKSLVRSHVALGSEQLDLLPFLDVRHVRNTGIAFGLLADRSVLVLGGTVLVAALLFATLRRIPDDDATTVVGVGLIAGGALGNLVDRVSLGYVTDWIHVPHWPTFNIADSAIVCGVIVVILRQWHAGARHAVVAAPTEPTEPEAHNADRR